MTKRTTKNALLMSILSLVLCMSMLVSTTFAWFTDSVESGTNLIVAGNLDVELYNGLDAAAPKVITNTALFEDIELWEPGAVVYENLTVANEGTLELKYRLALICSEISVVNGHSLAEVLKVAVVPGGFNGQREDAQQLSYNYSLATFTLDGQLGVGESATYGVVIYWEPTDHDNDFNVKGEALYAKLGVKLNATQLDAESDSFGPEYDAGTELPEINGATVTVTVNTDGSATMEANAAPSATTPKTTVEAPADTFNPGDKVEMEVVTTNTLFDVTAAGAVVASVDVTMTVNDVETSADLADGKVYTVTTYISKGLTNIGVTYTGNDGKAQPNFVSYDAVTGKLVFTTNHFSNYAVTGSALAYDVENDTGLSTIDKVIEATQEQGNTVVIPEENKEAIEDAIEELPEEKREEAIVATSAAKIGDVTYATLAEAFEAAQDGDTIVLLNNAALDAMITNTKKITLDLNGKTITGTDNTEKNFSLIDNRGTLTITGNGNMTVKATINSGWNRYSAVIANNPGGKLVIENGTFEHLGGTDMAYGIDNLTNGKGTYAEVVVNGGVIKSTYRGIRQFLNGVEAQNILTINGGTIEAPNKSVWMHDPSKNANTGKLTVSEKATLNGDVYLFVTAGSTKWPVEVSIAASAVNGEIVTGNVPAGYSVALFGGYYVVKSQPVAEVNDWANKDIVTNDKDEITLDCAFQFLPTETQEECEASGYGKWHADFVITVDKDVTVGTAGLAGYYSAWCELIDHKWVAIDMSGAELTAGKEFRLVAGLLQEATINYSEICEYAIRDENIIDGFLCGAYADESMDGVTLTVELRLYEVPAKGECENAGGCNHPNIECETGNYIVIGTYTHTFDNK